MSEYIFTVKKPAQASTFWLPVPPTINREQVKLSRQTLEQTNSNKCIYKNKYRHTPALSLIIGEFYLFKRK